MYSEPTDSDSRLAGKTGQRKKSVSMDRKIQEGDVMQVTMVCAKCKEKDLNILWKFKSESEYQNAYLSHDGFGLELTDALIVCKKCGNEMKYSMSMISAFTQNHGVGFEVLE